MVQKSSFIDNLYPHSFAPLSLSTSSLLPTPRYPPKYKKENVKPIQDICKAGERETHTRIKKKKENREGGPKQMELNFTEHYLSQFFSSQFSFSLKSQATIN